MKSIKNRNKKDFIMKSTKDITIMSGSFDLNLIKSNRREKTSFIGDCNKCTFNRWWLDCKFLLIFLRWDGKI